MTTNRISVSGVSSDRQSLYEDLDLWKKLGIDYVGVVLQKLSDATWNDDLRIIQESGLQIANVLWRTAFTLTDEREWARERALLRRAVEAAAELRAGCLYITSGPSGQMTFEEAADAFGRAIQPVAETARSIGVRLAMEHSHVYFHDFGFCHSLRDAIPLARRLGIDICLELQNCWVESDLQTLFAEAVDLFALVQVSDFRFGSRIVPDRMVPGDGDLPLERMIKGLIAVGYEGSFDIEMLGQHIEHEGYEAAIRRAKDWLKSLLVGDTGNTAA